MKQPNPDDYFGAGSPSSAASQPNPDDYFGAPVPPPPPAPPGMKERIGQFAKRTLADMDAAMPAPRPVGERRGGTRREMQPFVAPDAPGGVLEPGNIDLSSRPQVKNSDGSISTIRSIGINLDGREYLLPTVSDDGRILSEQEAIDTFRRTGKHLGVFQSPEYATLHAQRLSQQQGERIASAPVVNTYQSSGPAGALGDIRANEAARAQRMAPEVPLLERPATPEMLAMQPPGLTEQEMAEGSIAPWELERRRAAAEYVAPTNPAEAKPFSTAQNIAQDVREFTDNPVARGLVAGGSSLGQTGVGLVRGAADIVGAEGVSQFATDTSRTAGTIGAGATSDLQGNQKLVADVTASILNSAPSLALGTIGGPALSTLFAQSAAADYAETGNAAHAGIMGAAEALGERFGFPEQVKLLKGVVRGLPPGELAKVMGALITKEIPGEQLTTAMQFLADKMGPGARNPNATMADYLEQAGQTLEVTIGQAAVMGGGPASIIAGRQQLGAADAAVNRSAMSVAERAAADKGFVRPTERRKQANDRLDDLVAEHGLADATWKKAVEAAKAKAETMPLAEVPGFYRRFVDGVARRLGRPVDTSMLDEPPPAQPAPVKETAPEVSQALVADDLVKAEPAAPAGIEPGVTDSLQGATTGTADTPAPSQREAAPQAATPLDEAAHAAATSPLNDLPEPTDAQKDAGNYKVGRVRIDGLNVSIENPKGSVRRSKADAPQPWEVTMPAHYGYIRGTEGADGDHVDIFIGPREANGRYWVINQTTPDGKALDEHKVITGVENAEDAVALYKGSFADNFGEKVFGSVSAEFNADQIKARLPGMRKAKPVQRPAGTPATSPQPVAPAAATLPEAAPAEEAPSAPESSTRVIARAGRMPNATEPLELRANPDGTLTPYLGKNALVDFDSGEPLVFDAGISDLDAKKAIRAAGAVSSKVNFFPATKHQPKGEAQPPAPPVAAAPAPAPKPKPDRRAAAKARMALDPAKDSMLQALAKLGGIQREVMAREFGLKPEELKHTVATGGLRGFPFRKTGGMGLDGALTALREAGYFAGVADEDVRTRFEEAVYNELGGGRELTPQGIVREAEEAREAEEMDLGALDPLTPDELEESGYAELSPEVKAATQMLLADAERAGIDTEAIKDDAARATLDQPDDAYHARLQAALREAIQAVVQDDQGAPGADTGAARGGDQGDGRAAGDQGGEEEGRQAGMSLVPASGAINARSAITTLNRTMRSAGWEIDYIDLDLTGEKPKAEIRIKRYDGRWVFAKVDSIGRASFETFQRDKRLGIDPKNPQARVSPQIEDQFLGRQKFEGARSMLRGMVNYLADNALNPVSLEDMRSAWRGVMSAPVREEGRPDLALTSPTREKVLAQQEAKEREQADRDAPAEKPKGRLTGEQVDIFNTQGSVFEQPADTSTQGAEIDTPTERVDAITAPAPSHEQPKAEELLRERGFKDTGPGPDEWVLPVSGLGDVIAKIVSKPGEPVRVEISADYGGKRLDTRTAEGAAAIDAAIKRAREGIQQGRERMAAKVRADESGLPAPAAEQGPRRGTEDEARAAGFTIKAYRGVSKASPFNDTDSTWLTTSREVAEAYAEEVMGYDDPDVLTVMVKPDGLPRHDASRLTDEQRADLKADDFGNPQVVGIYDRSDDHPLGGSRRNVTVIHAPKSAVFVVAEPQQQPEKAEKQAEPAPMPAVAGIPRGVAQRAHAGTSHTPEVRAGQEQESFMSALRDAWARAARVAGADPAAIERITEVFTDVAEGYRTRYLATLGARSRVMSSMIVGPARFPVERNRKRMETEMKRAEEAQQYLDRGIKRLMRAARGPIDNSPESELERVRLNLSQREEQQETMKAANVAIRKGDDEALRDLGFDDEQIAQLKKGDFAGRNGFPDYKLTNNNAEIRRLRERLQSAEQRMQEAAAGPAEREVAGVRVVEDATADRIRLYFDGKPSEEVRDTLKANGFRWSPKEGAWQRQLTDNARRAANDVLAKMPGDSLGSLNEPSTDYTPSNGPDQADTRAGTEPQGSAPVRGDSGPVQRRARIVGLGIAEQIERAGSTALVGQRVASPDDLAALAQVYRDPRYETFRVFFVKGGKVIHSTGVSSRMPGETPMIPANMTEAEYIAWFGDQMQQTGADGYYILHNHPSGNPTPSNVDLRMTAALGRKVPGLLSHVVINSNRYAVIDQSGQDWRHVTRYFGEDTLLKASRPHNALGREIAKPEDLAMVGKSMQRPGWITLIGTSAEGEVRVVAEVPSTALTRSPGYLAAAVRRLMRLSGSTKVFPVGQAGDISSKPIQDAVLNGILEDGVPDSGRSLRAQGLSNFGKGFKDTPGMVMREEGEPAQGELVPKAPADTAAPPPKPPTGQRRLPLRHEPGWQMPEGSRFDNFVYKFQDKNVDLKRAVGAIKAEGKGIEDRWDAYLQEELFHGRAAKRTQDFVTDELEPLLLDMRLRQVTLEELDEFLHARHAKEANESIAERNPDLQDGGSGMKTADAKAYLDGLEPAKRKRMEALAKRVDAIIAKTRETYVAYGLESRATVDGWAAMFDHYVPLMREDKDGGMGIGQGFSIKGPESKSRTGSTRKVVDILANVALQREKAIVRGEKNRVAVALAGLVKTNPNPAVWEFGVIPTEQVFNPKTGLVETRSDPLYKSRPNVLIAKIVDKKGEVHERAVVLNEDNERAARMAAALKNLDATQLEGLLGVSATITRYFAAINTQYNPVFGVVNLVRDVQGAALNLHSTPLADKKAEIVKRSVSALRGIYKDARAVRKGKHPTSDWAKLWEEFQGEGGQTGFRDLYRTSEDRADAIRDALDPHRWMDNPWGKFFTAGGLLKSPAKIAQDRIGPLFDWLSDYNLTMENAVRLAAYQVAIEKGMSKQRAASLAKNLTVNFNRKGQAGQQVGALYAFFNAAVQGSARMADVLFDMQAGDTTTLRLSAAGKRIVAGGILLGIAQALALEVAGFDDDEPPDFVRERSLIIPLFGADKKYITIPMPLGWHVLPNIGRIATEFMLKGFEEPAKHVVQLVSVFAEAFNPIGNAGLSLQTIAPTAIDPLAALSENRDWTGKPIARESFDKAQPGHALAKDTASSPARWLSEAINWASGGTEYKAGAFSPTPDQIDYLIGQVTGGVGRELSKVNQAGVALLTGEDLPPHKIPLAGRFYGDASGQSGQASAFYDNVRRMAEHEAQIKGLSKAAASAKTPQERQELEAERAEYVRDHPEAMLWKAAGGYERAVQKLRAHKRELIRNEAPRAEIKKVEEKITEHMKALNDAVRSKREPTSRPPTGPAQSPQGSKAPAEATPQPA